MPVPCLVSTLAHTTCRNCLRYPTVKQCKESGWLDPFSPLDSTAQYMGTIDKTPLNQNVERCWLPPQPRDNAVRKGSHSAAYPVPQHVVIQRSACLQPNPFPRVFIRKEQPIVGSWTQRERHEGGKCWQGQLQLLGPGPLVSSTRKTCFQRGPQGVTAPEQWNWGS